MPRTKKPVKKREKSINNKENIKALDRIVSEKIEMIRCMGEMKAKNTEIAFKMLLNSIKPEFKSMKIGQLKSTMKHAETSSRRTRTSHDDGYLTANSSQGSTGKSATKFATPAAHKMHSSTSTVKRSRSVDVSSDKQSSRKLGTVRRRSRSAVYKTPACKTRAYPDITPKVTPHAPLTVLRQPRSGEMVVSMAGSPLLVPACNTLTLDEKANCNVLLEDGTLLSLKPQELRQSQDHIPFSLMNPEVLHQIKVLKNNLDTVLKLGDKKLKR